MNKKRDKKRLSIATLIAGVCLLAFHGCDLFGGDDADSGIDEPFFNYNVYDESGELVQTVTSERVGEQELDISLGIFGDRFLPPELAESLVDRLGVDPDDLNRNQIYLHAERGLSDEVNFMTLHFAFDRREEWSTGTFDLSTFSKERWLNSLENIWKLMRERMAYQTQDDEIEFTPTPTDSRVNFNIVEHMLAMREIPFMYIATEGYLELEEVSDEFLPGNFSIELAGLPADILQAEEFPDDPEFAAYRIEGSFAAEYGDFNKLLKARTDLFGDRFSIMFVL